MDNQPTQPTPPPPPSANSSKTFLLILGGIALMTVSAVGGYFLGANKQPQTLPSDAKPKIREGPQTMVSYFPTPISDETANWKTYSNTLYGFTFQYPLSHEIFKEDINREDNVESFAVTFLPLDKNLIKGFGVMVYSKKIPEDKSLSDIEMSVLEDMNNPPWVCETDVKKLTVSPILICHQKSEPFESDPDAGYPRNLYFISPQRYLFELEYLNNKNNEALINQILSTFKFTQ